ncbi:MAG: hypothetical protein WKF71_01495 [Pyrinomonadaceae bacterium]
MVTAPLVGTAGGTVTASLSMLASGGDGDPYGCVKCGSRYAARHRNLQTLPQ